MRGFVVIASLVALACADVSHLYDTPQRYQNVQTIHRGQYTADPVVNFVKTSTTQHNYVTPNIITTGQYVAPVNTGYVHQQYVAPSGFVQQQEYVQPAVTTTTFNRYTPSTGYVSNSGYAAVNTGYNGHFQDTSSYGGHSRTTIVKQTVPLVTKSSYVFAAPDEDEIIQQDQTIILPRPQQHYKVIFIKAPSSTVVNSGSTAVGGQTQEKTLVYVVSDKKRIENHVQVPEIEQSRPQKPEVFFIKHNSPTKVTNTHVKYQTVEAVHGAENGAVNGVPNRVAANVHGLQDEPSSLQQAQYAQQIFQAVVRGGLENGVKTASGNTVYVNDEAAAATPAPASGSSQGTNFQQVQQIFQTGIGSGVAIGNSVASSVGNTFLSGITNFIPRDAGAEDSESHSEISYGEENKSVSGGEYEKEEGYSY